MVLRTTYGLFDEKGRLKNPPKARATEEEEASPEQQDDDWF
jgi:hypothetical protein